MQGQFQTEKSYARDPVTGVIQGAEPFALGTGTSTHAVLFLHGWTSSPREMRFLAERVAQAGFYCQGLLLKGHGLTLDSLTPTRYADYFQQTLQAFDLLKTKFERVSICGLSMGGLLGLETALVRDVANLVLIAPFLKPWGRTLGLPNDWLVGKVPLWGNISKQIAGPIKNKEEARKHISYHAMPAHSMVSVVRGAHRFRGKENQITCPVLIHHDVHDTTSAFSGSLRLIHLLGSHDKTLLAYNRGNHVITLDHDRAQIESATVAWLIQHQTRQLP